MEALSRIRWRARRGMREMDQLFDRYIEQHYASATVAEKALFSSLLDMQDPELYDLLLGRVPTDNAALKHIIAKINPHMH